ncbi:bifunctional 2',3'-cyclic-nucleotide 2'-phosphodiesterase/3'-nucleotidase [Yoonia sp. BS5-3]|uniref:Bifunctional 2',3'-cyclic-nucleotide 2'-phosphodiesterase/3'-nucleotidase n=1 Tax=Yoonia phaeophyticola TaxID=3137369 RepID=A0ABZ2V224_9RHOB
MNSNFGAYVSAIDQPKMTTAPLRILETTDLHMQLLNYDYFSDKPDPETGLIQLVDSIKQAQSELGPACLLFDNGDLLQGNPLADYLATHGLHGTTHPMIAALNALGYDGMALGNHEFDYGLDFLRESLKGAAFPIICGNLTVKEGPAIAAPYVILDRMLTCSDGQERSIKIGVTGFAPPQITQWDGAVLAGAIAAQDIVQSAQQLVPDMKSAGADLIIALCHSGIKESKAVPGMENAAVPLAAIDGIDVVLTGHTHELFPGTDKPGTAEVDPVAGTLHGKPAVMPGFYGRWLGVIDLELRWNGQNWSIHKHQTTLQKGGSTGKGAALREKILKSAEPAHQGTLAHIRQPIAATENRIHSYFATVGPDASQQLLANAKMRHIRSAMQDSQWADLPVIAATAPFRFGDRAGVGHYIDIPAGPITLRDAAAIYPFANTLCAVLRNGAELRTWLERAAAHFMQIQPGRQDQPLVHPHSAGYNFDTLFGLNYEIDLAKPARFDSDGRVVKPDATRIKSLNFQGKTVDEDDQFIVATNSYRTYGGGGVLTVNSNNILYTSAQSTRDILIDDLRKRRDATITTSSPWRLTGYAQTSGMFRSSPKAQGLLTERMTHLGGDSDGFDRYRLNL